MPTRFSGGVPMLDFSTLGDLGRTYKESRNEATLADLGKRLASGDIDYKQAAGLAAGAGKLDLTMSLLQLAEDKEGGKLLAALYAPQGAAPGTPAPGPQMSPGITSGPRSASLAPIDAPPVRVSSGTGSALGGLPGYRPGERFMDEPPAPAATPPIGAVPVRTVQYGGAPAPLPGAPPPAPAPRPMPATPQAGAGLTPLDTPPLAGMPDRVRQALPGLLQNRKTQPQAIALAQKYMNPEQWRLLKDEQGNVFTRNTQNGETKLLLDVLSPDIKKAFIDRRPGETISDYEARNAGMVKQAQVNAENTALTSEQKNARASEGMTPLTYEGAKKQIEVDAKHFSDTNVEIIKGARSAGTKIQSLNRLDQLLSMPGVYQGKGGEMVGEIQRLGKAFNFNIEGAANVDAIRSITRQHALELRNPSGGAGMPGAMSDSDRAFLASMPPGLDKTPEGNKLILDYTRRVEQRAIDVERLRQDYVKKNGRLNEGFFTALSDFSERNPLFPEATKQDAAPAEPIKVRTIQEAQGLPKGTRFIDPNGVERIVP